MTFAIYVAQIILLCADAYMVLRSRRAFNGLWWELIVLFVFLAIRRLDDMVRNADQVGILILSSVVVVIVSYGVYRVYRDREALAFYLMNRKERIAQLEKMRQQNEAKQAQRNWDDETIKRYL